MKLNELTAHELHIKLSEREISCRDVVEACYTRIKEIDQDIKAFITLTEKLALSQADEADKKIDSREELQFLNGIPIAVKDLIITKGIRTTCGSHILDNYIPQYDGTISRKIKEAGTIILGKTNMDEFAMGSSNETSYFGPVSNPYDFERVPGGSSGGSAASVAANETIIALGSDTGGSIRQPASLCGIVGLKPTYGLISRYGLVAFASSLDQIGPMTKDVTDCALLLQAIAGYDPDDSTSIKTEIPDYMSSLTGDIKGLKIGVLEEFMGEGLDSQVKGVIEQAIKILEGLGAEVGNASLPHADYALPAYYLIAPAEASSNLARFDGVRYGFRAEEFTDMLDLYKKTRAQGFGAEVKRRIMIGTYALSAGYYEAFYGQAQKVRTLIIQDFKEAFSQFDLLVSPTSPTVAFKIGEKTADPLQMYLSDIYTIPANLAGLPGISLPAGLVDGLPVGLQILGNHFQEEKILQASYAFEQAADFKRLTSEDRV